MLDLRDVYDRQHIHTDLGSLFKYNYIPKLWKIANVNQVFALNNEGGILICTWPKGGRPSQPLLYSDETQIGYELQVAGNLFCERYILEGLTIFKSTRDRFNGKKRNPYNEFECGNHYIRSLANYSAILVLSGYGYSGIDKSIILDPKINSHDSCVFFSMDSGWGILHQRKTSREMTLSLKPSFGHVEVQKLTFSPHKRAEDVTAYSGSESISVEFLNKNGHVEITLEKPIEVKASSPLIVKIY